LQALTFTHYTGQEGDKQLPMAIVFDTSAFLEFQKGLSKFGSEQQHLIENANILYETFREYLIPVVTIQEKSVEDVFPIFERINSTGTQLNQFDLMVAATWSDGFDLNDQVNKIRESTKLKDFENTVNEIHLPITEDSVVGI
jgi:hypothetical protein